MESIRNIALISLIVGFIAILAAVSLEEPEVKTCVQITILEIHSIPTSFNEDVQTEIFLEKGRYVMNTTASFDYETEICDDKYIRAKNDHLYKIR